MCLNPRMTAIASFPSSFGFCHFAEPFRCSSLTGILSSTNLSLIAATFPLSDACQRGMKSALGSLKEKDLGFGGTHTANQCPEQTLRDSHQAVQRIEDKLIDIQFPEAELKLPLVLAETPKHPNRHTYWQQTSCTDAVRSACVVGRHVRMPPAITKPVLREEIASFGVHVAPSSTCVLCKSLLTPVRSSVPSHVH